MVGLSEEDMKEITQIYIVACGSAYHTGVVTQYVMEDLARVPVRVELASEFRYRNPILQPTDLVIVVSQSGETADTLGRTSPGKRAGRKDTWYCKCRRFLDCKRSRQCLLYHGRS